MHESKNLNIALGEFLHCIDEDDVDMRLDMGDRIGMWIVRCGMASETAVLVGNFVAGDSVEPREAWGWCVRELPPCDDKRLRNHLIA